jgi:hypothetical protein
MSPPPSAFQGGLLGLPNVAQGVYLAVTVRLENISTRAHGLGKNRFKITDSQGREFSAAGFNESFGAGSYGSDISFGRDVIAGGALEGILHLLRYSSNVSRLEAPRCWRWHHRDRRSHERQTDPIVSGGDL